MPSSSGPKKAQGKVKHLVQRFQHSIHHIPLVKHHHHHHPPAAEDDSESATATESDAEFSHAHTPTDADSPAAPVAALPFVDEHDYLSLPLPISEPDSPRSGTSSRTFASSIASEESDAVFDFRRRRTDSSVSNTPSTTGQSFMSTTTHSVDDLPTKGQDGTHVLEVIEEPRGESESMNELEPHDITVVEESHATVLPILEPHPTAVMPYSPDHTTEEPNPIVVSTASPHSEEDLQNTYTSMPLEEPRIVVTDALTTPPSGSLEEKSHSIEVLTPSVDHAEVESHITDQSLSHPEHSEEHHAIDTSVPPSSIHIQEKSCITDAPTSPPSDDTEEKSNIMDQSIAPLPDQFEERIHTTDASLSPSDSPEEDSHITDPPSVHNEEVSHTTDTQMPPSPSSMPLPKLLEPEPSYPGEVSSTEEPMFTSPPPPFVEPDVPDPFLVDDPENPMSDDEEIPIPDVSESQQSIAPAEDIPLTRPSSSPPSTAPLPSANLNKAVPPPPPESDDEEDEEEEAPEIYLPALIIPTMFLPIPNTDPLTTLLTKYIYPPDKRPVRDLTGEWQRSDFHTLVMTNSWRSLARMARDRIVTTDPEDLTLILGLWYLRLACLARLRLFNQTSAECTNLFSVLNTIEPPSARAWLFDRILPFELEVMQARLKYWAGDHMAYLDALNALLKKCKTKAREAKSDTSVRAMWQERGSRICLILASQLMEMKDFTAAAKLLEPLCKQPDGVASPALRSSLARIYLQGGYVSKAAQHFEIVSNDPTAEQSLKDMDTALLASAQGDWELASSTLRNLLEKDADNYVAVNNLSVALLSQGKLKEGIEVLENALNASPSSVVVAEPFLFNLSTLYELRSATAVQKKRDLLIEVAKWSGDGLKTTCLKMPST